MKPFTCSKLLAPLALLFCLTLTRLSAQTYGWANEVCGSSDVGAHAVTTDAQGNVITAGYFFPNADLDPGIGTTTVNAPGISYNCYIQKLDSNGNFLWGGSLESQMLNSPHGVQTDAAGNIYVVGEMLDSTDFDIGPGVHRAGMAAFGTYMVKLAPNGALLWVNTFSGAEIEDMGRNVMVVDPSGNVYLAGNFQNTVDFDPGLGVHALTSAGQRDGFLAKYNSSGNLQWVNQLGGATPDNAMVVAIIDTSVYVAGVFSTTVDFDPGVGITALTDVGTGSDIFVARYAVGGALVWAKSLECSASGYPRAIATAPFGKIVVAGSFQGSIDLDPGLGAYNLNTPGNDDMFVVKLDSVGDLDWGKGLGGPGSDSFNCLAVNSRGAVFLGSTFDAALDFDPGLGVHIVVPDMGAGFSCAMLKLDDTGNFVSVNELDSNSTEILWSLEVDDDGAIIGAGTFGSTVDFDPGDSTTAYLTATGHCGFLFKWEEDSCAAFTPYIDSVQMINCTNPLGSVHAHAIGGVRPYSYAWSTVPPTLDSVATIIQAGVYWLMVTDTRGCQAARGTPVNAPTSQNGFDLEVNLVAGNFRPNIPTTLTLDAFNNGCAPVSGQVVLVLDSQVTYQTATPTPSAVIGDTLFWNFTAMDYDDPHFIASIIVRTDLLAQVGDSTRFDAIVTPIAGDQQPTDNAHYGYGFPIGNSYDPNIKSVYPPGVCDQHFVLSSDSLIYTVQFQNTGTAEALEISILDTIDSRMDIQTFALKGSSHPVLTTVLPGNILRFDFHNIHLPDSSSNEPASHGYVIYQLLPMGTIGSGAEVRNRAAIYFDFNAPVITNETMTTFVPVLPQCPVGVAEQVWANEILLYPNPATSTVRVKSSQALGEILVVNMMGQVVFVQHGVLENEISLDVSKWAKGIFSVSANGKVRRLVVE